MKHRKTITLALTAGLIAAGMTSAQAGTGSMNCNINSSFAGQTTRAEAKTWQSASNACGYVQVNASFRRPGDPVTIHQTGVRQGPLQASVAPGGVLSAVHSVTKAHWPYGHSFTTRV